MPRFYPYSAVHGLVARHQRCGRCFARADPHISLLEESFNRNHRTNAAARQCIAGAAGQVRS